jgi:hypothetical protein
MHGAVDLGKYSLKDDFWLQSIRVCTFSFNTLAIDERPSQERLANSIILDCGITTVDVPDLDETKGTTHFALKRNLKLQASSRLVIAICLMHKQTLKLSTGIQTWDD